MKNDTEIWLERLTSLYKSQIRQVVNNEGIQLVHFEILEYLNICNHYSNTAQAISEYLGQTKGSISQSLKVMLAQGYLQRRASSEDGRVMQLFITKAGKQCLQRMTEQLGLNSTEDEKIIESVKSLLIHWQTQNAQRSFGQCQSCRFNRRLGKSSYQCGLTGASLEQADIFKICREHEFNRETLN